MAHWFIAVVSLTLTLSAASASDVPWHKGPVDEAFETAKQEQKPLFLYWGAVWCPPCNEVKKTIFAKPEFAERMRQFIPVYLDGDDENAQTWGEKLEVRGYPTMLVLSPDGEELVRLSTGVPLAEFLDVLDDAQRRAVPLERLAREVLANSVSGSVPRPTWRRLAFASWTVEREDGPSPDERAAVLARLAAACPSGFVAESSRLWSEWLTAKLEAAPTGDSPFESEESRRSAAKRIIGILDQPEALDANIEFLSYAASDAIAALAPSEGDERRALVRAWQRAMTAVSKDGNRSIGERIHAMGARIDLDLLGRAPKESVSRSLRREVRREVARANREAQAGAERQAVMSSAARLLLRVGMEAEARTLLEAEVERSASPYYFMSALAQIERDAGHPDAALKWFARAYESSRGRATRFQWGVLYLVGLMELAPMEVGRIRGETLRVLGELMNQDDAFAGRNLTRVGSLGRAFKGWNTVPARLEVIEGIRGTLGSGCERWEDAPRDRCDSFFAQLGG